MFQANTLKNTEVGNCCRVYPSGKDSFPRGGWYTTQCNGTLPPLGGVCIALGDSASKNSLHWTIALWGGFGVIYRVKTAHSCGGQLPDFG
jgi:hypothetical protein